MLADAVRERLAEWLAKPGDDRNAQLDVSLRLLCKWRSALIQNTVQHHNGTRIWSGPFEDIDFLPRSTHACHVSKLVGCYEQPLQPFIEEAIRVAYPIVLNIGCAEGYYAVGMAARMPDTRVDAFDIDPAAQRACGEWRPNAALPTGCGWGRGSRRTTSPPTPDGRRWYSATSRAPRGSCWTRRPRRRCAAWT